MLMQEFAEDTMNELLGWYGLANRDRHGYDMSIGYHGRRRPDDDLNIEDAEAGSSTKGTSRGDEFSASPPPRRVRSASSTSEDTPVDDDDVTAEKRLCDWCRRSGPCPTCIAHSDCTGLTAEPGEQSRGLAFCDETCLSRYKMKIFCMETQQQLQLLQKSTPSSSDATVPCNATTSSGSGADMSSNSETSTFLVTPELWMTSSTPARGAETKTKKRRADAADNSCHSSEDLETTTSGETQRRFYKRSLQVSNGGSPVEDEGCYDAHSQSSEDSSKRDVIIAAEAGTRPLSVGNSSGRRSTSSSIGGPINPPQRTESAVASAASVPEPLVWNAPMSGSHSQQSAAARGAAQRRDGWRLKPQRSPHAGSDAKRFKVRPEVMTSSHVENVEAHRAPSVSLLTSTSSSMPRPMPLFAPWFMNPHQQQQQQQLQQTQQQYPPGNDVFAVQPNCYANGVPMWTPGGQLAQSSAPLGNAAVTHETLMRFAAAAAAAAASAASAPSGTPVGLNNGPLGVPPSQMSSFLSFLTGPSPQVQPQRQVPPVLNPSAVFRPALNATSLGVPGGGALPPNTLLVPYPVPMPLPVPIPIPIPVPFDCRLMAKAKLDGDTSAAVEQCLRSLLLSYAAAQPEAETTKVLRTASAAPYERQDIGDAVTPLVSEYERRQRRRNSPEVGGTAQSPPMAHGSTFVCRHPQQTSALDFSTSARTEARSTRRDDVISPPSENTSVVESSRIKIEPIDLQRPSFSMDVDRTSALPPTLPYSARRSLILDAPPPPSLPVKPRDSKRDNNGGVAEKRLCARYGVADGASSRGKLLKLADVDLPCASSRGKLLKLADVDLPCASSRGKFGCKGRTGTENGVGGGGGGLADGAGGLVVKTH